MDSRLDGPVDATDGASLEFRRAELTSPVVVEMIRALNAELEALYPEEGANHFRLDPEEVADGRGALFVGYLGGKPVACGAIRRIGGDTGEIKRMFVVPDVRGQGVGRRLLARLEDEARRLGVTSVVLETGSRQRDAVALYRGAGFVAVPAFGEYANSPLSVCMRKLLS